MARIFDISAGKANQFIHYEVPSNLIPFKGDFPIVPSYKRDTFHDEVHRVIGLGAMAFEECSEWVRKVVDVGEKIYDMHHNFSDYLSNKGKLSKFQDLSPKEKEDLLYDFMDKECIGYEQLIIKI